MASPKIKSLPPSLLLLQRRRDLHHGFISFFVTEKKKSLLYGGTLYICMVIRLAVYSLIYLELPRGIEISESVLLEIIRDFVRGDRWEILVAEAKLCTIQALLLTSGPVLRPTSLVQWHPDTYEIYSYTHIFHIHHIFNLWKRNHAVAQS